jgi:hypothetical protein
MSLKDIRIIDTNRPKSVPRSLQQITKPIRTCSIKSTVEKPAHLKAVSDKPAHVRPTIQKSKEIPRVWSDGTAKLLIVMEAGDEALLVTPEQEFNSGNQASIQVISKAAFFSKFKQV